METSDYYKSATHLAKSPLRYRKLIAELPKHEHAQDALLASGFSKHTARTQSKRVLQSALRYHAKEMLRPENSETLTSKELMSEIVGLSKSDVMDRLKSIAMQDKDLASALKVLSVLAKEYGVKLDNSEQSVVVPILNIVVEENQGLTEPLLDGTIEAHTTT